MIKRWLRRLQGKDDSFQDWRKRNPHKPFREYYAERAERTLRKLKPHRTWGSNLLLNREFGRSGADFLDTLVQLGLKPQDVCVDYGCGTLRVGIHLINFLRPEAYWGLDVTDFVLQEGRKLAGDRLWSEKRPQLRVISAETVSEVAASRPIMVFAHRVLNHVHPDELSEFFENILEITGSPGQAIITGNWSDGETIQKNQHRWTHSITRIGERVEAKGGVLEIIGKQGSLQTEELRRSGLLRIVRARRI